jgi:hypothetical protein
VLAAARHGIHDIWRKTMTNQPAQEIRLGRIRATIWANTTEQGVRYNVIFTRLYKSADEWQDAATFARDDLLLVAKVADLAHTWIVQQNQTELAA